MDTDVDAELRELRLRAYGPDADIHEDPVALTRLRQLEADAVPVAPTTHHEPSTTAPEPIGVDQIPVPRSFKESQSRKDAVQPVPTPRVRGWQKVRIPVMWAASVLIAIALTATVSNAYIQGQHDYPGDDATQVVTLREDSGWDVPSFFTSEGIVEARGFEEFYGMRVVLARTPYMSDQYDACMSVVTSEAAEAAESNAFDGPMFTGCGANGFPAAVTFKVTSDLPLELQQAFPIGTALQFVLDAAGGDVVVFSSTVSTEAAATVR